MPAVFSESHNARASETVSSRNSFPSMPDTPASSVRKISLSARKAIAHSAATSSKVTLKISPVGEYPRGDIRTSSLSSSLPRIACESTLRTSPVYIMSTPSTTPRGRAATKLPEATRISLPAIGELGSPMDNNASISTRKRPLACFTQASASSSVMRTVSE